MIPTPIDNLFICSMWVLDGGMYVWKHMYCLALRHIYSTLRETCGESGP